MFIVSEAFSWLVLNKYFLIDQELILKFNLLQRILYFTKAIFLSLFFDVLYSSVTGTDNHNHHYVTRQCLVLMFYCSFFFSPSFIPRDLEQLSFQILEKVNCTVCSRLHIFIMYHTALKATQKFRVLRLKMSTFHI